MFKTGLCRAFLWIWTSVFLVGICDAGCDNAWDCHKEEENNWCCDGDCVSQEDWIDCNINHGTILGAAAKVSWFKAILAKKSTFIYKKFAKHCTAKTSSWFVLLSLSRILWDSLYVCSSRANQDNFFLNSSITNFMGPLQLSNPQLQEGYLSQ